MSLFVKRVDQHHRYRGNQKLFMRVLARIYLKS